MSYYLKYRPQTIGELDLVRVRQELGKILTAGRFAHAYLFAGPKGTGKTSSARILAKVVNCEKNRSATNKKPEKLMEPCNQCPTCRGITAGSSLAVIEMDAASNRGIDDIRALREKVALAPAGGAYTVYVIDEVHMLTNEAFNALLKTIEEPPEHAIFVLCTTEIDRVPETIVSRCTLIAFTKATVEEVVASLEKVVKGEKLKVAAGGLERLAARVDGSFRDGMKWLEQLAIGLEGEISHQAIDDLTGFASIYRVEPLVDALREKKTAVALAWWLEQERAGADVGLLAQRLVEHLRAKVIDLVNRQEGQEENELGMWLEMAKLMATAAAQMKTAVIESLPMEMAMVEWGIGEEKIEIWQQPEKPIEIKAVKDQPKKVLPEETKKIGVQEAKVRTEEIGVDQIEQKWAEIMRQVRPANHSIEALLRSARPLAVTENKLVIEVFYTFHKEQLEQERHRRILEEVVAKVMQAPLRLDYVLGDKAKKSQAGGQEASNVTGKVADENLAAAAEEIFGA